MKTWQVGVYGDDWCVIVHADTRAQAKTKALHLTDHDFTILRAVRIPELDGKLITKQALIDAGFPETWEGDPVDITGYILDCGCELCAESLKLESDVALG